MIELDLQRFEKLAQIFNMEFSGGAGVIDDGVQIVPEESPTDLTDDNDDSEQDKNSEEEQLQALEYEELKSIQLNIEEYIAANDLTDTIGTELTGEGLLIRVRTDI